MSSRHALVRIMVVLAVVAAACEPAAEHPADRDSVSRSAPAALMPVDHSDITGTAAADRTDQEVEVTLVVEGVEAGATYLVSAHRGSCAFGGPELVPLGRVEAGEGDVAEATFKASADEIPPDEAWSIQILGEAGETLACADIVDL